MLVHLLALNDAVAFDCAGRDPISCAATLQLVDQINEAFGPGTVVDGQSSTRRRPLFVYNRIEEIRQIAAENECLDAGTTIRGTYGGRYDLQSSVFRGPWAELGGADFGDALGDVLQDERMFMGTFTSDVTASGGDLGDMFASYTVEGQLAGDRDGGFLMGVWVRVAGSRGYYAAVYGDCADDPRYAFDDWYAGDLTSGITTVALDDAELGVEMTVPTLVDPLMTVDAASPTVTGSLTLSRTGPGVLTVPTTPAIGVISGNGTGTVVIAVSAAAVADVEAVLRGATLTSPTQGTGVIEVVFDAPGFAGVPDSRTYDVGPLDLIVGPGGDHTSIAAAINQVRTTTGATGSTIRVEAGDYQAEGILTIANDPDLVGLTLLGAAEGRSAGANPDPARGDALSEIRGLRVNAASVTVDGFDALVPNGVNEDGFGLVAPGITLRNSTASKPTPITNYSGVVVRSPAVDASIQDCAFSGFGYGAFLQQSSGLEVTGSTFQGHQGSGVEFHVGQPFPNGTERLTGNAFADNVRHVQFNQAAAVSLDLAGNSFEGSGIIRAQGGVAVDATGSWWGQASGALPAQIVTSGSATVDTSGHLTSDPFPSFP